MDIYCIPTLLYMITFCSKLKSRRGLKNIKQTLVGLTSENSADL